MRCYHWYGSPIFLRYNWEEKYERKIWSNPFSENIAVDPVGKHDLRAWHRHVCFADGPDHRRNNGTCSVCRVFSEYSGLGLCVSHEPLYVSVGSGSSGNEICIDYAGKFFLLSSDPGNPAEDSGAVGYYEGAHACDCFWRADDRIRYRYRDPGGSVHRRNGYSAADPEKEVRASGFRDAVCF